MANYFLYAIAFRSPNSGFWGTFGLGSVSYLLNKKLWMENGVNINLKKEEFQNVH